MIYLLKDLLYENNQISLTRLLSVTGFAVFLIVSVYLAYKDTLDYVTFATICGGGGIANQTVNKYINSRYNSIVGGYSEQKGGVKND